MNILVVSLYYEPDQCQSNGPIIRALCEDWAAAGHRVTVLTSFPHYSRDSVWPEYRGRWFERDRVGAVDVLRSYIFVPRTRSSLGRALNYLSFNLSSTLAGLFAGRQDVIFVMSPPLTIGGTAYLLGRWKGIPFCYNLQDIWPEVAVRLGQDLAPYADIGRRRQARERALGRERRQRARAVPGQGAAEGAPAPAQAHRHEVVAAGEIGRAHV